MPKSAVSDGRRRSASISSTLRWYDSLSVSARLAAVSVLPSAIWRAGHHEDFRAALFLQVMQRRRDTAVLFDARVPGVLVEDQLLDRVELAGTRA